MVPLSFDPCRLAWSVTSSGAAHYASLCRIVTRMWNGKMSIRGNLAIVLVLCLHIIVCPTANLNSLPLLNCSFCAHVRGRVQKILFPTTLMCNSDSIFNEEHILQTPVLSRSFSAAGQPHSFLSSPTFGVGGAKTSPCTTASPVNHFNQMMRWALWTLLQFCDLRENIFRSHTFTLDRGWTQLRCHKRIKPEPLQFPL